MVKLGSSTVVGDDGKAPERVLRQRVADLVALWRTGHRPVLVSSGAAAPGRGPWGLSRSDR